MKSYQKRKLVTARLNHDREVSSDGRSDPEGEGHNGESNCSASFGCSPAHHGSKDHCDGQDVTVGEESEVVVLDCQTPPDGL